MFSRDGVTQIVRWMGGRCPGLIAWLLQMLLEVSCPHSFKQRPPHVRSGREVFVIPVCSVARRSRANRQPALGRHNHHNLPLPLDIACIMVDVLECVAFQPNCTLQPLTCSMLV